MNILITQVVKHYRPYYRNEHPTKNFPSVWSNLLQTVANVPLFILDMFKSSRRDFQLYWISVTAGLPFHSNKPLCLKLSCIRRKIQIRNIKLIKIHQLILQSNSRYLFSRFCSQLF